MFKKILFDVDGVLLSEEHYFDASALTVWELLFSPNYMGLSPEKFQVDVSDSQIKTIRKEVFQDDRVLALLKSKGLNANWDMIYLTFSYHLIHLLSQTKSASIHCLNEDFNRNTLQEMGKQIKNVDYDLDFSAILTDFQKTNETKRGLFTFLNQLAEEKLGGKTNFFKSKGALWSIGEHVSQEWYVGDEHVLASTGRPSVQTGKSGFLHREKTLGSAMEIASIFQELLNVNIKVGIGTGRPELETISPFRHLDWLKYFHQNNIVTADDVLNAEKENPNQKALAKPHPFTYVLAHIGKSQGIQAALNLSLPIEDGNEVLIIGDSLADLLAAREMGCQFAAVLTGLSGKKARKDFEEQKADYILDSIFDLLPLIKKLEP